MHRGLGVQPPAKESPAGDRLEAETDTKCRFQGDWLFPLWGTGVIGFRLALTRSAGQGGRRGAPGSASPLGEHFKEAFEPVSLLFRARFSVLHTCVPAV